MITLAQANHPDWDSLAMGATILLVLEIASLAIWFILIGPYIERVRRDRIAASRERTELMRDIVHAEVLKVLGHGDPEEIDPDDFEDEEEQDYGQRPGPGGP